MLPELLFNSSLHHMKLTGPDWMSFSIDLLKVLEVFDWSSIPCFSLGRTSLKYHFSRDNRNENG